MPVLLFGKPKLLRNKFQPKYIQMIFIKYPLDGKCSTKALLQESFFLDRDVKFGKNLLRGDHKKKLNPRLYRGLNLRNVM